MSALSCKSCKHLMWYTWGQFAVRCPKCKTLHHCTSGIVFTKEETNWLEEVFNGKRF